MDALSDVSRASQIFSSCPPRPHLNEPIVLDELLGFDEAVRKKELHETITDVKFFDRNKIFINYIDSFVGKYLALVLSRKDIDKPELQVSSDIPQEGNLDQEETEGKDVKGKSKVTSESHSKGKGKKEKSPSKPKIGLESPKLHKKGKSTSPQSSIKPVENIEDMKEHVCEETVAYDTSRLTVAEYYEMMELEAGPDREGFLKEKFGKYAEFQELSSSSMQDPLSTLKHNSSNFKSKNCNIKIFGTLKCNEIPDNFYQEGVKEIIQISKENEISLEQITRFGVFIYIVNEDIDQVIEATWFFNSLLNKIEQIKNYNKPHEFVLPLFVLVSSFMTWSLTKPFSSKEPELPFIEKDYRKRKPHPNYQLLYELEEQVIKAKSKGNIEAIILVSGIPYGHEESVLSYHFEKAYNCTDLSIYNSGNNVIPVVHVENIGKIVSAVIKKTHEIKLPFLFMKDPLSYTLKEMIKSISNNFGSGCCKIIPNPCAFLEEEITQNIYDHMTANIRLESCYPLFNEDSIEWTHGKGFVENIKHIIKEYTVAKDLKPINIVIYNPGCAEVNYIPIQLSEHYHVPYLSPDTVVQDYITGMQEKVKKLECTEHNQDNMETRKPNDKSIHSASGYFEEVIECQQDPELEMNLEFFQHLNIKDSHDLQNITDSQQIRIIKEKMKKRLCLNKGYVLHNFPNSLEQAELLYFTNDNYSLSDNPLLPDYIVWLNKIQVSSLGTIFTTSSEETKEINEDFEGEREDSARSGQGDYKEHEDEEDEVVKSISEVNSQNIDELSISKFFLENNEHCRVIRIDIDEFNKLKDIVKRVVSEIEGTSNSYEAELDESSGIEQTSVLEQIEKEKHCKEDKKNIGSNGVMLDRDFKQIKEAEEIILANRSYPLLSYLIKFVYPTLTNAILEVTAQRPEDPLDFLAEYLFKNNPDGRMIDPNESKLKEKMRNKKLPCPQIDSKECLA